MYRLYSSLKHASSGPGVYIYIASYIKNFLVCEFGGFENVLCDAGIRAIPSTDVMIIVVQQCGCSLSVDSIAIFNPHIASHIQAAIQHAC